MEAKTRSKTQHLEPQNLNSRARSSQVTIAHYPPQESKPEGDHSRIQPHWESCLIITSKGLRFAVKGSGPGLGSCELHLGSWLGMYSARLRSFLLLYSWSD